MAYDEQLGERVRVAIGDELGLAEKKMFGGLAFLLNGNMALGVIGEELCVRVGPDAYDETLAEPHARLFDFTGRPMKGWVMVGVGGFAEDDELVAWVERGLEFAGSLPPK